MFSIFIMVFPSAYLVYCCISLFLSWASLPAILLNCLLYSWWALRSYVKSSKYFNLTWVFIFFCSSTTTSCKYYFGSYVKLSSFLMFTSYLSFLTFTMFAACTNPGMKPSFRILRPKKSSESSSLNSIFGKFMVDLSDLELVKELVSKMI